MIRAVVAGFLLASLGQSRAAEVPPPDGGSCWTSTFGIIQNEIVTAIDPTLSLDEERKYLFCKDTVYRIAAISPDGSVLPDMEAGEQWPLLLFTPNVHLYCESNCTLEMIASPTNVLFGATTQLVQFSGLLPPNATVPPSLLDNLTVDGFTIQNADNVIYEDTSGVITLGPPGRNILLQNMQFESVGLAGWAIASEYYAAEAILQPEVIPYQSVTIRNCTFLDSAFDRAAIISFAVDESPPESSMPTNFVTLEDLQFDNCSNTGSTWGGGFKGLLTTEDLASVTASNLCFVDNASANGTLLEFRGDTNGTDVATIYGSTTMSLSGMEGDNGCGLSGVILSGECVTAGADSCPLTDEAATTDPPTEAPTDTTSDGLIHLLIYVAFIPGMLLLSLI